VENDQKQDKNKRPKGGEERTEQGYLFPKTIVRSDINLEKWSIFASQKETGYRVMERSFKDADGTEVKQTVRIGLPDSPQTLTAEDAKIFYLLLDRWEKSGRNEDGIIHGSFRDIYMALRGIPRTSQRRFGNYEKKWFAERLLRMVQTPIVYQNAYKSKEGAYSVDESFTLLQRNELFERKSDQKRRYFAISSFTLHPLIIKSILKQNMRTLRLDVIVGLKKEISVLIYRHLDLILNDKTRYERNVKKLAEDLNFGASRRDNLVQQVRAACAELRGKDISSGRIVSCDVERMADGRDWKLVVVKGARAPAAGEEERALLAGPAAGGGDAWTEEAAEAAALLAGWEGLSPEEKEKIQGEAEDIFRTKYRIGGELTRRYALLDALRARRQTEATPVFEALGEGVGR
jgi:hypothetical protein